MNTEKPPGADPMSDTPRTPLEDENLRLRNVLTRIANGNHSGASFIAEGALRGIKAESALRGAGDTPAPPDEDADLLADLARRNLLRGNTPAQEPLRAEALKAEVRKLADWSRERWDDVRGGDPIARTLNAVFDIIDRAALSVVPVEPPATPGLREALDDARKASSLTIEYLREFQGRDLIREGQIEMHREVIRRLDAAVSAPPATLTRWPSPDDEEAVNVLADAIEATINGAFTLETVRVPQSARQLNLREARALLAALSGPPATEGEP